MLVLSVVFQHIYSLKLEIKYLRTELMIISYDYR